MLVEDREVFKNEAPEEEEKKNETPEHSNFLISRM